MAPKFGTSGLRGLVTELTDALVGDHVAAFLAACDPGTGLYVARDLRPSSPRIASAVIRAARARGLAVTDCGAVPTPALALAAMGAGAASVMVTGSHIPADRNGLKFYLPGGEITKADEAAILAALGTAGAPLAADAGSSAQGPLVENTTAGAECVARYVGAFGAQALAGRHIGVYSHSAVGRDLLMALFSGLGARVSELGRADHFIPVDTEAVDPETRAQLQAWAAEAQAKGAQREGAGFDAIVSTDGDGDRPLLCDATGAVIPGDSLGQITAAYLGAETVVTTVSANSGAELGGAFARVIRARIGSPYVIAAMEAAGSGQIGARIVGYEPNGGFLLGFAAQGPAGVLAPLMTRDAFLPLVAPLLAAKGGTLAARVAAEPARFTATDRLQEVPTEATQALVAALTGDPAPLLAALDETEAGRDLTDGLRLALASGRVVHLRPSGNAPELRVYAEAESPAASAKLLQRALGRVAEILG